MRNTNLSSAETFGKEGLLNFGIAADRLNQSFDLNKYLKFMDENPELKTENPLKGKISILPNQPIRKSVITWKKDIDEFDLTKEENPRELNIEFEEGEKITVDVKPNDTTRNPEMDGMDIVATAKTKNKEEPKEKKDETVAPKGEVKELPITESDIVLDETPAAKEEPKAEPTTISETITEASEEKQTNEEELIEDPKKIPQELISKVEEIVKGEKNWTIQEETDAFAQYSYSPKENKLVYAIKIYTKNDKSAYHTFYSSLTKNGTKFSFDVNQHTFCEKTCKVIYDISNLKNLDSTENYKEQLKNKISGEEKKDEEQIKPLEEKGNLQDRYQEIAQEIIKGKPDWLIKESKKGNYSNEAIIKISSNSKSGEYSIKAKENEKGEIEYIILDYAYPKVKSVTELQNNLEHCINILNKDGQEKYNEDVYQEGLRIKDQLNLESLGFNFKEITKKGAKTVIKFDKINSINHHPDLQSITDSWNLVVTKNPEGGFYYDIHYGQIDTAKNNHGHSVPYNNKSWGFDSAEGVNTFLAKNLEISKDEIWWRNLETVVESTGIGEYFSFDKQNKTLRVKVNKIKLIENNKTVEYQEINDLNIKIDENHKILAITIDSETKEFPELIGKELNTNTIKSIIETLSKRFSTKTDEINENYEYPHDLEIQKIDDSNFQSEVLNSSIPVIVQFSAEFCAPCKRQSMVLQKLQQKYNDKIKIVTYKAKSMDGWNILKYSKQFFDTSTFSYPTLGLFKNGKLDKSSNGADQNLFQIEKDIVQQYSLDKL